MSAGRIWLDAFRGRGPETGLDAHLVGLSIYRPMETVRETSKLAATVVKTVFTSVGWVREAIVESSRILRIATLPILFASAFYMVAFGSILLSNVIYQLGAGDRAGPGIYLGLIRTLATWTVFMIFTAIIGSAVAGDLGARKIREELDAMDVLGVNFIRTLVVPRVVALVVCSVMLVFINLLTAETATLIANTYAIGQPFWPQVDATFLVMNVSDVVAAALKGVILGFFIGIVACHKGMTARGGTEGVGRAVNETVVICFFGIWLVNTLFNTGYLSSFPDVVSLRG